MRPLVPSPGGIPLAFARTPFSKDVYRDALPFGLTVAEIARTIPDLPDRFWTHGCATLSFVYNGRAYCDLVPRKMWSSLRLSEKPVEVRLDLHIRLGGGGGGGSGGHKSVLALVASIAVVAASAAISGGALAPFVGGGLLAAGSTSSALLAAGVGILGGLAVQALTPPPTFDRGDKPEKERTLGSASASGNQLEPGGVIPRVIGTFRAFPSFGCMPLVDIDGDDEIVEAVFVASGPHKWQNIRVDGVPIGSDHAYAFQTREGWDDDTPITLVMRQGFTEAPLLELSSAKVDPTDQVSLQNQAIPTNSLPKWHTVITRLAPDEVWLTLAFPEGGFRDDQEPILIPVRLRIRRRGTVDYINFPEIHFRWDGSSPFKRMIKLKWTDDPDSMPTPLAEYAPVHAYKVVPAQNLAPVGIGGWTADAYFSGGSGDDLLSLATFATSKVRHTALYEERVEFYLGSSFDPFATFSNMPSPETVGSVWEIQSMRGQSIKVSAFTPATYEYDDDFNGVFDLFGYYDDGAHRLFGGQKRSHSKIIITRVASVWNEHPIAGTGLALLAVTARNKAVQGVSALLSGYVPDWNGSSWTDWRTTSRPAAHYRYILAGGLNVDPLPEELLDDAGLVAWRTRCSLDDLRCDMIADGRNLDELLKVVASCGFARPRQSEFWGVVQDRDRSAEAPVQIFTPRNSARLSYQKAFPLLPHGLRVRYRDRTREYEDAPVLTVYDEGYSADGAGGTLPAERLEEITYDGITDEIAARARATFDMAQSRLRATVYSLEVDAEGLVATRGDLFGLQHDILARSAGFARVKEKILESGNVIGLRLDSKIPTAIGGDFFSIPDLFTCPDIFAPEGTTGIAIRMKDGSGLIVEQELSDPTGYTDEVEFETPFLDPGDALDEGCLIASGELGTEYLRLILSDVQPAPDLRASLTGLDEAPGLWPEPTDAVIAASSGSYTSVGFAVTLVRGSGNPVIAALSGTYSGVGASVGLVVGGNTDNSFDASFDSSFD